VSQSERMYRLKNWFDSGRCLSREWLLREMGVSRATLMRDIAYLRDRLSAPIAYDPERRGWYLDRGESSPGTRSELPGLWFDENELAALLTTRHLLGQLDASGFLAERIEPLRQRVAELLGAGQQADAQAAGRIRLASVATRRLHLPHFQMVARALLLRRCLRIGYHARSRQQTTQRTVSPQRLVYYRDNWYLDAWCHLRDALRSFAVDSIVAAQILDEVAREVPDSELDDVLASGYGIFAGATVRWATLRFGAERARWVSAEVWHPDQQSQWDAEGRWLLRLPFADPRELVMDILRHVPEVEVLAPYDLEEEVLRRLRAGVARMEILDE